MKKAISPEERDKHRHARWAVNNARAAGELVPAASCERCGSDQNIEASHDDYDKPLDVEWLCRDCHIKKDRGAITRCPRDHEYTEANTYLYRGKRYCKECRREQVRNRPPRQQDRSYICPICGEKRTSNKTRHLATHAALGTP